MKKYRVVKAYNYGEGVMTNGVDRELEYVFATHPDKPNFRSNTRGRIMHIKRDDTKTLCNMILTKTPLSISLGYGFTADEKERGVCKNCMRLSA